MNPENLFFTADTHFMHRAMPERWRTEFPDIETHDRVLIEQWNDTVPADGHVFHLGDVSFGKRVVTADILQELNGRKYLVEGNHDRNLNVRAKGMFEWCKPYHKQKVHFHDETYILIMCHYAFRSWDRMHYGTWNLHGHSHGNLPKIPAQLDVGVDYAKKILGAYRPWRFDEIAGFLHGEISMGEDHHKSPKGE